jgi:hypothetical protein
MHSLRNNKKRILSWATKLATLLAVVVVIFQPFGEILLTPIVHAAAPMVCEKPYPYAGGVTIYDPRTSVAPTGTSCPTGYDLVSAANTSSDGDNGGCSIWASTWSVCVSNIVYVFTVGLGTGVAYVGAYVFSLAVKLSLTSLAYGLDFITSGWSMVRDIANMFFILILIYIGVQVMFDAETSGAMKTLAWVVFVALVINFSFFFTRVVIDGGNILTIQFYNAIQPSTTLQNTAINTQAPNAAKYGAAITGFFGAGGDTKDLTASIMGGLSVQTAFSNGSFSKFKDSSGNGPATFLSNVVALSTIYIFIGAILFALAAAFFTAGIKFVVRIVVLWFTIIVAPMALVAWTVPRFKGYFDRWFDTLIRNAIFYPVVFMFVFLVITQIMGRISGGGSIVTTIFGDLTQANNSGDTGLSYLLVIIAAIGIRLGFVLVMFYLAFKAADEVSDRGSDIAHTLAAKIPFMNGLKSYRRVGGVAFQQTAGRTANKLETGFKVPLLNRVPVLGQIMRYKGLANTGYGNSILGQQARGLTTQKVAGAKFGGAGSYKDYKDNYDKLKKSADNADKDKKNKDNYAWMIANKAAYDAAKNVQKNAPGTLSQTQKNDIIRGDEAKNSIKEMTKREIEATKMSDLKAIAGLLSEGQAKIVKESEKFGEKEKSEFNAAWHKEAGGAPLQKMQKQIELLRKIEHDLSGFGRSVAALGKHTAVGAAITPESINLMRVDVEDQMAESRKVATDRTSSDIEKTNAQKSIIRLQKAVNEIKTLEDNLKDMPANIQDMPKTTTNVNHSSLTDKNAAGEALVVK